MKESTYHTVVIGAGQAGLAMGYYLRELGKSFLLVDSHSCVGDSWRKRYDSLVLFTPRRYSALPGLKMPGEPTGYPSKDEVADYLEMYAHHFRLPIQLDTLVTKVLPFDSGFRLFTDRGEVIRTQFLVIATGPFMKPFIPQLPGTLSEQVTQIHTAGYRNPRQLQKGNVMVVGAGNSGVQIATELARDKLKVYLSVGKPMKMLPHTIGGKSLFWWFDVLGISKVTAHSRLGQFLSRKDPIIGKEALPYIKTGEIIPVSRTTRLEGEFIYTEEGTRYTIQNVVWATGYQPDYHWLQVPGVVDQYRRPVHQRGVSPYPGLFFLGLSWQHTRGSALIMGVGKDAQYLYRVIQSQSP